VTISTESRNVPLNDGRNKYPLDDD